MKWLVSEPPEFSVCVVPESSQSLRLCGRRLLTARHSFCAGTFTHTVKSSRLFNKPRKSVNRTWNSEPVCREVIFNGNREIKIMIPLFEKGIYLPKWLIFCFHCRKFWPATLSILGESKKVKPILVSHQTCLFLLWGVPFYMHVVMFMSAFPGKLGPPRDHSFSRCRRRLSSLTIILLTQVLPTTEDACFASTVVVRIHMKITSSLCKHPGCFALKCPCVFKEPRDLSVYPSHQPNGT